MLVCISCAENQQCVLEFTISSGRRRKYSNEKGKSVDQSAAFRGFLLRFFLALLRWLHLATKKKKEKKRWVGGHFCCFVCFVCFTYVLVGGTRLLSFS